MHYAVFKKLSSKVFFYLNNLKSYAVCINILFRSLGKSILILDLDNTLSLTGKWFDNNNSSDTEKAYENANSNQSLITHLINNYPKEKFYYLIISARSNIYYNTTKEWINDNLKILLPIKFILVNSAMNKLSYYRVFHFKKIIIFDDLTYNHENLEIKKYTHIENLLRSKKNIKLYSDLFINQIK